MAIDRTNHPMNVIGIRHGEKLHESLLSSEEHAKSMLDGDDYFRVPVDSRDLNYDLYHSMGDVSQNPETYSSNNTKQLGAEEVAQLLLRNTQFNSLAREFGLL